jgi:hypothetical protein
MSFLDAIDPKRGGIGAALRSNLLANEKYIQESDVEMKAATERAKEKAAKIDAEEAKLDPNVLTPPKLEKWTAPPQTSPLEAFGSSAGVLASLGGLLTRRPLTASLNAAAGVLDAYKRKDAAAAQTAFDEWKINTENAVKLAHFELDAYRAALSKIDTDRAGTYAEVRNLTAVFQNHTANQILVTQGLDGIAKYENDMRIQAGKLPEISLKLLELHTKQAGILAIDKEQADRAKTPNPMTPEERINKMNRVLSGTPESTTGNTGKWEIFTDPERVGADGRTVPAKQYRMNDKTGATTDLAGQPYTPTGAVKATARSGASSGSIAAIRADAIQQEIAEIEAKTGRKATATEKDRAIANAYGKSLLTGNAQEKLQTRVDQFDDSLDKIGETTAVLDNLVGAAGVGGKVTRLGERIGNVLGSDTTERVQFMRNIDYLQLMASRLLTDASSRPLHADAEKITEIIGGLNMGDTTANTMRSLEEVRKLYEKMQQDTLLQLKGQWRPRGERDAGEGSPSAAGGAGARSAPSATPWSSDPEVQ